MYLQFAGDISPVCNDCMGGKEETVGYFAVGHSFDDTDNDFLFAGTQCLLFIAIPFAVFAFGMQALQFELHFV